LYDAKTSSALVIARFFTCILSQLLVCRSIRCIDVQSQIVAASCCQLLFSKPRATKCFVKRRRVPRKWEGEKLLLDNATDCKGQRPPISQGDFVCHRSLPLSLRKYLRSPGPTPVAVRSTEHSAKDTTSSSQRERKGQGRDADNEKSST
jgi:hypothetical protein